MLFSVTIPAYKAKYLYEAISSILQQTYQDFEIIIVDDSSPEDIKTIVDKFTDPRIHYYRNEKNCGAIDVVDNWNKCLSYAQGNYVICMGDDDMLLPNCLENYHKLIMKYPGLGVYHAWTEIIDEEGNFYKLQHPRPEYESVFSLIWNRWNGRNRQYIGDFCFDAALLKIEGGFYKLPLAWGSDDITSVRAAAKKGIANMQTLGFVYRQNRYTITSTGNVYIKLQAIDLEKEWYRSFFANIQPDDLSQEDKLFFIDLQNSLDSYYNQRMKYSFIKGLSLGKLIPLYKLSRKYNIPFSLFLRYYVIAIITR